MTPAPSTWTAVAWDIQRRYETIRGEDFGPDEFWRDEQERADWFEEVADLGRALAELILAADETAHEDAFLQRANQVAKLLNEGQLATAALAQADFDPEDVFSEDPGLSLDDPDNDIVDLGTFTGRAIILQRIGGSWHVRVLSVP